MTLELLRCTKAPALVGLDFEYTFADVYKRAVKISEALPENTGKAAICAENSPNWVFACYGAWFKGATVVPIDAKSSAEEIAFVLNDANPEVVFACAENLQTVREAVEAANSSAKIMELDGFLQNAEYKDPAQNAVFERELDDLGLIVYTSGTTGNPKGVMLTFANMAANMKAVEQAKYYFRGMSVLAMLPFHHILPLMGTMIMPLSIGGKIVMPRTISPEEISAVLQKYPVDLIISVPRFYELLHSNIMAKIQHSKVARAMFALSKLVGKLWFSRKLFGVIHKKFGGIVRFWVSGGAALDKTVWSDLYALGFSIREGYGMTECAPIIAFPRIDKIKMGSVGQALNGIEVRIVDGEIAVRGGNVTKGYYNRPEETAESIRNGWLYTGDLGYLDDDGFLFITGRQKEIIVLANGKNVNPAELETLLQRQSPDVLEAGVLMYQNTLRAIVRVPQKLVSELGAEGAEKKIRDEAILPFNRNAPTYKRIIKFVLTTDELPRTRVGKLKRHLLAAYIENGGALEAKKSQPEPENDVYKQLKSVLEKQISLPVDCDAHMEMDLGLDSLGKIAIQCFAKENYGVEVSERDFETNCTLRTFAEMVSKNRDEKFEGEFKNVSWSDIVSDAKNVRLNKPNFMHRLTVGAFRLFARVAYKMEVSGADSLPDDRPLIFAANHQSYLDGVFAVYGMKIDRVLKTYFFAKIRNILKNGMLRAFADHSNVIVMDINDDVKTSIQKLVKALEIGGGVVIFPEGTRTKDGDVAEFKQTFAIIAKETGVPVVPVCIAGAFENIPVGKTLPNFGSKISVSYLPQMTPQADESYEAFAARVREAVDARLAELSPSAEKR